jgi:hypothetical protein
MTVGNENRLNARVGQRRRREGKVQGRLGPVPPAINRNGQALEGISDSDTATGQGKGVARRCTETQFILNRIVTRTSSPMASVGKVQSDKLAATAL